MRYNEGRIAGRMRNIFEKRGLRCGRDTKNAPKEGACLYDFTREATELFCISSTRASDFSNKIFGVLKQDVRSSQTRCSEFTNKMFGVHKQDVRSLNTMLKVSQEQKGSDIEHKDTQTLRIVRDSRQ